MQSKSTTTVHSMCLKEIVYDRETHDYAMYLDGELVGFARTYHDAEVTLDQLVFELWSDSSAPSAPTPVPLFAPAGGDEPPALPRCAEVR